MTLTRPFLVVRTRDLGEVVVPLAGLPPDATADVEAWCRAAGVPVRG